ncbi:MAG: class I SAM-dependent methyltransferase [Chloroflexota bacterium]|nr:class I SAM-dependent methyltransferase [Chloroflexota bacterium]
MTERPPAQREPGSYRDPSGFVFRRDGVLYRQVNQVFADDWAAFESSGLHAALVGAGVLVADHPASIELAPEPGALAVIRPDEVGFISHPFEWSFSQLKDAALLTLKAQTMASERGMTLRDASAYNIQFHAGRPILIDTLSFERVRAGEPWKPYRQFCEHFLAPLALMAHRDGRMGQLLRTWFDGIPLDLAAKLLPRRTRFSPGLTAHVHLHARAQRRHAGDTDAPGRTAPKSVTMSDPRRQALLDHLRRTVEGQHLPAHGTQWADYADQTSYSAAGTASKEAIVQRMLEAVAAEGGKRAWDVGANTGRYSAIAAEAGFDVIALDGDWAAVERDYLKLRAAGETRIMPLLADIADPPPGIGWANTERASLLQRANADVAVSLALVHHLAIGRNVPLPMIAELHARLAPHVIIEWVPKEDPMVRHLLSAREDVFPGYTMEGFRAAFATQFEIVEEAPIEDSSRVIFRMRSLP